MTATSAGLIALTAQITSAHCANNTVEAEALPGLIRQIYQALASVTEPVEAAEKPVPAVPPKRSVFPDYIVCLEDGKKLKMLKRHLNSAYGMTPADYRARWDLPQDYPMVAPNYAEKRSALAKQAGLGHKIEAEAEVETATDVPEIQYLPERKRSQRKGWGMMLRSSNDRPEAAPVPPVRQTLVRIRKTGVTWSLPVVGLRN